MVRYAMLAVLVTGVFSTPSQASNGTTLTRREIREMPILERPSRPGHFYGNTVRRNFARQVEPLWPQMPQYSTQGARPLWSDLKQ